MTGTQMLNGAHDWEALLERLKDRRIYVAGHGESDPLSYPCLVKIVKSHELSDSGSISECCMAVFFYKDEAMSMFQKTGNPYKIEGHKYAEAE